ncbi:MAG: GH3 auxin-responsive promoter family protein, partial [Cyclobacteriaceae bacterium]
EPYRAKLFESIGKPVDSIETYPASEGFFAYQDSQEADGLLLLLNSGIYFEFIPADQFYDEDHARLTIGEVEVGVNYVMIISSNAGLWGYNIGDTIKFVSTDPYRVVVTGRIKHFISAFGEHVIGQEVEKAMNEAIQKHPETEIVEFTVAPNVTPTEGGMPHHQWLIEFSNPPGDAKAFAEDLDAALCKRNSYYDDLIVGHILKLLEIIPLQRNAFIRYMKDQGKLGGQNKVPRLSNDRKIADELIVASC